MNARKCPLCKGTGSVNNPVLYDGLGGAESIYCEFCKGTGKVTISEYMLYIRDHKGCSL